MPVRLVPVGEIERGIPLQRASAEVCCRAGLDYQFEHDETGWKLALTDVARPDCSPEPLVSDFVKRGDAQHDLMEQAVSRGLKGYAALPLALYERHQTQILEWVAE
jgi:hypothetical protein